jgi:uncharacterized protein (DUF1501 family)
MSLHPSPRFSSHRRALVTGAAALGASSVCGQLWAAPTTSTASVRLLVIFLRGGYDSASLLVPLNCPFYRESRPNLAIAEPGKATGAALGLDADWALHPALSDSLLPLWRAGELAFVPFAGTEDLSRSHFETQDSIEMGQPLQGPRDYQSGFLNRLAVEVGSRDAIAFTEQLPLAMRGQLAIPNVSLAQMGKSGIDARQSRLLTQMYGGSTMQSQVEEGLALRDEVREQALAQSKMPAGPSTSAATGSATSPGTLAAEMAAADRRAAPPGSLQAQARLLAGLMRDRHSLAFLDVGGWDTHVGQGGASGVLATRLQTLGQSLSIFASAMGPAWRDTMVVVLSEFGRTFRENGNRGTDHGHGTVYWVLGGAVRGGRIAGEQVRVGPATLHQNRDYPVLNDYRGVLGGLFARAWGLDRTALARVFAQASPADLGLL